MTPSIWTSESALYSNDPLCPIQACRVRFISIVADILAGPVGA